MFTRLSNFTYGLSRIANTQGDALEDNVELIIHIKKYEQECLRLILGATLFDELMQNVELDGNYYKLKESAIDKWGWLLNGKEYTVNDESKKWIGLVSKVATINEVDVFETLMANYVFYHWSLNNRTINVGTGEGEYDSKAIIASSGNFKRVDVWNEFVKWASYGWSSSQVSLYQFLEDKKLDFPTVNTTSLKTMTYYDI